MNSVLEQLHNELEKNATTWNGAISNSTTGSHMLDYFSKCGTYTGRTQEAVDQDMELIFSENPGQALKLVFGLRMISRKGSNGFGRRDEFQKCLNWLDKNHNDKLVKNLHLIPVIGCWKDIIANDNISNTPEVFNLVIKNLRDGLLLKYLPQIKSKGRIKSARDQKRSDWAKAFCKWLGIGYREYRRLKSGGTAHTWQKQMSSNDWDSIDFNKIPGKAFTGHISKHPKGDTRTVFERHGQVERLKAWVKEQGRIKFNGYPYELVKLARNASSIQQEIYNKQFEQVLEGFKGHTLGNTLVALDTSGSMTCEVVSKTSAMDIGLSLGLVFSALNNGSFKDHVMMFDSTSKILKLSGTFCQRLKQIPEDAMGSTNFQSVIDELVRVRQRSPFIPLADYPKSILIVSDMQFNPADNGTYNGWGRARTTGHNADTNHNVAKAKLQAVGLGDIRIIWWYVNGESTDFVAKMNDEGTYIINGFDPNVLKVLIGEESKPKVTATPLDGMVRFLNQPALQLVV